VLSVAALTVAVNTTDDVNDGAGNAGHCSLREAILAANANADVDTIAFNIPGPPPYSIPWAAGSHRPNPAFDW
jgi:CSLREA domain-containing protein